MYPKIEIKINGIIENIQKAKNLCEENYITLSLVTKLLAGNSVIVKRLVNSGVSIICDSRIQNFIKYQDIPAEKWLIRSPSLSEIAEVVQYTDVSLNSELTTLKA